VVTRFKVAGIALSLRTRRPTPAAQLPPALRPFACARGDDIRLTLSTDPIPQPRAQDLLFDSGGVWRVYRWGRGLLYTFSTPALVPPVYKALIIDRGFRRGVLHYPRPVEGRRVGSALDFPLDELLFQHRLAQTGGLELHACGVALRGKAVLFCGKSGAGKTTTARLWQAERPEATILSDDRVIVRAHRGRLWAWGTPWHGAGGLASPTACPVGAVFFLRHGARTTVRRLDMPTAAAHLFARTFPPPWDRRSVKATLATCARLATDAACFLLSFRPDRSAVRAVIGAIGGETSL
jgi:hypothetical protein